MTDELSAIWTQLKGVSVLIRHEQKSPFSAHTKKRFTLVSLSSDGPTECQTEYRDMLPTVWMEMMRMMTMAAIIISVITDAALWQFCVLYNSGSSNSDSAA